MNKPQLYEECKRLREYNMRLHLFQDDNLIKENEELEKENERLINDVSCLEDHLKNQTIKFSEELRDYNLKFYEEKKEEEKCTMSSEEEMNMVEKLSEELGEKELRIMALEKELEKAKDSINFAVVSGIAYECRECNYLTENRCKKYEDKKFPDEEGRCWECRNDDTSSEEEEAEDFERCLCGKLFKNNVPIDRGLGCDLSLCLKNNHNPLK